MIVQNMITITVLALLALTAFAADNPGAAVAHEQEEARAAWQRVSEQSDSASLTLDCAPWTGPAGPRPPRYYEGADGWLHRAGERSPLDVDESQGFPVRRFWSLAPGGTEKEPPHRLQPLALALFVATKDARGPLVAKITLRGMLDSSSRTDILWDGQVLASLNPAAAFAQEKEAARYRGRGYERAFYVVMPGPQKDGRHELRIRGGDTEPILVRRLAITGGGKLNWTTKPKLPGGGKIEVVNAYYMPDPRPNADSQAITIGGELPLWSTSGQMKLLVKEHADFGGLRVVVRNTGRVPTRIEDPLILNGKPIEDHFVDFLESAWDARGVVWYRIRPRLLQPGEFGQIYIRFRRRPAGDQADLEINLVNGRRPARVSVPYADPGFLLDYVTTGPKMRTLYVYLRRKQGADPGKLTQVMLDGQKLANTRIYGSEEGSDWPGNVVMAVADLAEPLKPGDYHIVGVQLDGGKSAAAQFRVLDFFYPRNSLLTPISMCREMNLNTHGWDPVSLEKCEQFDMDTMTQSHWGGGFFNWNWHRRVKYVVAPDEPDARDYRAGGFERGLGYYAREMMLSGWQDLVERFVPHAPSWMNMNGTTRPLNWGVYGQVCDISGSDIYPVTYYGGDHAYVREHLTMVRLSSTPKRLFAILEAFNWRGGSGVPEGPPGGRRGPIPAEYRQNVVQAIGTGMKGLSNWAYPKMANGWELSEPHQQEIASMNRLIEHIEADLLIGTPIDLASSDAGLVATGYIASIASNIAGSETWDKERVWVGSLLCGPDTIVLAAANHIPTSKSEPPTIEPAENVTITVALPDYLQDVAAFEATEDGVTPFARCTVANGKAILKVDVIESGRVLLLRRKQ